MMKVYDIRTRSNRCQTHSVVSENMAEAERLFKEEYPYDIIVAITLHSEYVIIQGIYNE